MPGALQPELCTHGLHSAWQRFLDLRKAFCDTFTYLPCAGLACCMLYTPSPWQALKLHW